MPPTIDALVFDFDGLILDTETAVVRAWAEVFESFGAVFPVASWHTNIGRGADQDQMSPVHHLELQTGRRIDGSEIERQQSERHLQLVAELDPLPGVRETIGRARELGIALGIASSSPHEWIDRLLEAHGLLASFEAVLCADDVERAKPFPDLYTSACRALGTDPTHTLALEDSTNGISAAKSAGLWCVAVPNGVTIHMDLSAADRSVSSLGGQTLDELIASLSSR